MLEGKDCSGDKYRHLLGICNNFKSRPDGYFGFPKSYVPANEAVHREISFKVLFNIQG